MIVVTVMRIGMSKEDASESGYHHGLEGKVTPWVCVLINGTAERKAWMAGYKLGQEHANDPYTPGPGLADWPY